MYNSFTTWCPYPEAEACVSKLPRQEAGNTYSVYQYKSVEMEFIDNANINGVMELIYTNGYVHGMYLGGAGN